MEKRRSPGWGLLSLTGDPTADPSDVHALERAMLKLSASDWKEIFPPKFEEEDDGRVVTDNDWFNKKEAEWAAKAST